MFSPARNDYRLFAPARSRGIALLVMMSLFLVAFTAITIGRLSLNSIEQKNNTRTVTSLAQARDAIMAFALVQATNARPPGTLPCPDTDGDGISNPPAAGACASQQGLVPFVTLGIARTVAGLGTQSPLSLWYVIAAGYGGDAIGPFIPRNSSRQSPPVSTLTLNGQAMAFVVIDPGKPLNAQSPSTTPIGAVSNFLEAPNDGINPNYTYSDFTDLTHNDKLSGMAVGTFWTSVEGRVLAEVRDLIQNYRNTCGAYPWAVPYAAPNDNGVATPPRYQGRVPLTNQWFPTVCPAPSEVPAPVIPQWVVTHWTRMLYYAVCNPFTNCLNLDSGITANVIVMAPGVPLTATAPTQIPRVVGTITRYFEGTNNIESDDIFIQRRPLDHTDTFNDLIFIVH